MRECSRKAASKQDSDAYLASAYVCDVSAFYSRTSDSDQNIWLADSGASMHMTYRREYFSSLQPVKEISSVKIANNKILPVTGIGIVVICEEINGRQQERELRNVL